MLQNLHIVNFAIIEDTVIELEQGATVFTGETGAGKSILVDALAVLTGRRASTELIRSGADFFSVEGVFAVGEGQRNILEKCSLPEDESGQIVITRRMNRNGRSLCTVNGVFCSVKQLETLGRKLIKLHEQHDDDLLLSPDFCRQMICQLSPEVQMLEEEYILLYQQWKRMEEVLHHFDEQKQAHERRLDILQWEIQKIVDAAILPGEDEAIERHLNKLENYEKIYTDLRAMLDILQREDGVESALAEANKALVHASSYDKALETPVETLASASYAVEETIRAAENYIDQVDFSEKELSRLQERDEVLKDLKRKYGPELKDVIAYGEQAQEEYDRLHEMIFENGEVRRKFRELTAAVLDKAQTLNEARRREGHVLCRQIAAALQDMGMLHARLELYLTASASPSPSGTDEMELYFSANVGEPMKPLRRTASGGEMSRISLAIETVTAGLFARQTLVFDEIDTGISGKAALQVAEKIRRLSETVQVLCITHLPQTASIGDHHYRLEKQTKDGRTFTRAVLLGEEDHLKAVAQMISGDHPSAGSIESARELCRLLKK